MKKASALLIITAFAALTSPGLYSQTLRADSARNWLMLVATNSTDPEKEAQFNTWYDDIDIPDVLEVPGYMRARRGRTEQPRAGAGRYVALYDIESENMDRTIIDMLMATRKMESRKRSTPLLEVVERLYYRRYAPPVEAPHGTASPRQNSYVYVERLDCCGNAGTEGAFDSSYNTEHIRALLAEPGFVRATRYELYRVLMVDPVVVPRFLTVYDLHADSAQQALRRLPSGDNASTLYLQIRDVRRPAGAQ